MFKSLPTIENNLQIRSYPDDTFRTLLTYPASLEPNNKKTDFENYRSKARTLISQVFDNLNEFEYLYFTHGVTNALDLILPMHEVQADPTEYRYVFVHKTVTTAPKKFRYQSWPSSFSGKFEEIKKDQQVILDCSYLFASNMCHERRIPENVSYLLIGFSKGHNLSDVRVGCLFAKQRIVGIHALQYDYGYGDSIIGNVLQNIETKPFNYLYEKYDYQFRSLYNRYDLQVGDTNLFGIDKGKKYPFYVLDYENKL